MASSRVIIDNRFGKLQEEMDRGIERSLGQAAGVTIATAKHIASRYDIKKIQDDVEVGRPRRTRKGWELDIVWRDYRVWFFERGTYAKKGALRTRRKNTVVGSRGVKPVRFIRQGMKVGRLALLEAVARNLR